MDGDQLKQKRFYLSRRLIVVVGIFILAASGLTVLTNFSINIIAASGDYSTLISQWNRHHYQSAMHVERLARTGNPEHFNAYQDIQTQKNSLQRTVDELFSADPDVAGIFQTFDNEQIKPNEISGLITVFDYFHSSDQVSELNRQWETLKEVENRQHALVKEWYRNFPNKDITENRIQKKLENYNALHEQWTQRSKTLMASVGDASGVIKQFGLWISVILGILLVLIGVVFTVRANKSIGRWEEALHEKDILLAEIHHRVKNNMAVISGMLELESMNEGNADRALRESRDRIKSMAMIHEKLYQSKSFSDINLADYLDELTDYICSTYIGHQKEITVETNFDPVQLNINQAVPVGLIINEIMANAIEHGFQENSTGTITISVHQIEDKVQIQISDDGDGLPEDVDFTSSDSTGSAIVGALIQQINGDLTVENDRGLKVNIVFQKSDATGSSNALF
ncbi:sensor histidine kinase [Fodinibius sp. SL11]|uniref:sensor histidine kinase n=1 Tax=Fodinibius sp. SL11 TaxID=3425690 RepID=UPI003F881571